MSVHFSDAPECQRMHKVLKHRAILKMQICMILPIPDLTISISCNGFDLGHNLMAWAKFSCASLDDRGKLASFAPSGESKSKAKGATAGRLTVQRAEDELPANLPALLKLLGGAGGLGQHATATPFSASIGKHEVEVDTARLENVKQMPLVLEIKVLADGAKFNGVSGSLTDVHSQECLATGTIKLDQLHSSAGNEIDLDCSQAESQGVQMKMKVKLGPLKTTPTTAATLNALAKQDWDLKDIAKVLTDASAARKLTMEETYQTIGGPESEKRCQQVWFNLAHGSFTPLGSLKTDLVQWGRLAFEAGSFVDRYADITRAVQISVAKRLHSQGMTLDATSLARLSSQAAASSDVRKDLATAFHSELTKTCALNSVYRSDQAVKCVKLNISGGKTTADVVLESGEAQNTLGRESNATALQRDRKLEQLQYKSAAEFAEGQRLKHTMPGDCEDLAAKAHQAYRKLHTEQRDTFRAGVKQSFETNHSNPSHVNTLLVDIATHIQTGAHELRRDGFSWGATLGFARGAKVADNKAQSQDSQHTDGLSVSENFANRVNKIATHEVMGHAFQCADELIASQELPNGATLCVKKIANIAESTAVTDVNTALPHDNVTVNAELHTESSVDAVKRIKKTLPFDVAINLKTEIIGKELARRSGQNVVTQHYGNPESESSFWNMLIASADENGDTSFFCDISHRHGQTDLDQLFKMQWAHQGHQLAVAEHVCAHAAEQLLNCACACVVGKAKARVPCCRCPDCGECELPRHARALSALVDAGERDLGNIGAEFEAVHDLATACGACGADKAFVNELNTETLAWTDDGRGIDIDKNNAPVVRQDGQPLTKEYFDTLTPYQQSQILAELGNLTPGTTLFNPNVLPSDVPANAVNFQWTTQNRRSSSTLPVPAGPMPFSPPSRSFTNSAAVAPAPAAQTLYAPPTQVHYPAQYVQQARPNQQAPYNAYTVSPYSAPSAPMTFPRIDPRNPMQNAATATSAPATLANMNPRRVLFPSQASQLATTIPNNLQGTLSNPSQNVVNAVQSTVAQPGRYSNLIRDGNGNLVRNPNYLPPYSHIPQIRDSVSSQSTDTVSSTNSLNQMSNVVPAAYPAVDRPMSSVERMAAAGLVPRAQPTNPAAAGLPSAPSLPSSSINSSSVNSNTRVPVWPQSAGSQEFVPPPPPSLPPTELAQSQASSVRSIPQPPSMNLNPPAFRCPLTTLTLAAAAHASGVAKGGAKKRRAAKTGIAPLSIAPLAGIAGELKRNDGLVFSIKMPVPEGSEEMAALRALGAVMAGYVVSSSNMDADKVMPFDKHFAGCEGPVTFDFKKGAENVPVVVFTPRQQRIALAPSLKAARQISAEKFDPEKEIKARQKFAESQGLVVKMHLTESDCMYALCK